MLRSIRFILLALILCTLVCPIVVCATDADEADAHEIAVELGAYDPINGDARWVYTDGALIISYRVQSASNRGVTIVRANGNVVGRWERELASNTLEEVVFLPFDWDAIHVLADGI